MEDIGQEPDESQEMMKGVCRKSEAFDPDYVIDSPADVQYLEVDRMFVKHIYGNAEIDGTMHEFKFKMGQKLYMTCGQDMSRLPDPLQKESNPIWAPPIDTSDETV